MKKMCMLQFVDCLIVEISQLSKTKTVYIMHPYNKQGVVTGSGWRDVSPKNWCEVDQKK